MATVNSKSLNKVIDAANARSKENHHGGDNEAAGLFEGNGGSEVLDRAGIHNSGYITKKGCIYGVDAMFNALPPGMEIEDQEHADIRGQRYVEVTDLSYPGDGFKG